MKVRGGPTTGLRVSLSGGSPLGADLDERTILKALDGRLAKYKQPKRVLFVEELPRNALGKVLKHKVREELSETEE